MEDPADDPGLFDAVGSEALQNEFMGARADALDDGLFTLTGGDAVAAAPEAGRRLSNLRDTLLDRADTPRQRAMLADTLNAHMDVARDDIARHVARQTKVWDEAVRAERVGLLQDRARRDYDDPDRVALRNQFRSMVQAARSARASAPESTRALHRPQVPLPQP